MSDGWELVTRLLRGTLVACAVVLVVTGIPLFWHYEPELSQWSEALGAQQSWRAWLRDLHRLASWVFVGSAFGALLVALVRRWQIGFAVIGVAVAVVGSVTGSLVAWDQVGLRAVTIGETYRGALAVARSGVRFAIVDGAEISPAEYLRMLAVHTAVVPLLGLSALALLRWRRRQPPAAATSSPRNVAR